MASTVPARASSTARSTAWAATRPASSGRRAWGALRSSLPSTVTSASSGPSARAFAATSGPMPRGSPTVTARRGRATRSGADVDVRRAAQDLEVVLYRELLAHVLADPILHVVEGQLTLGQALHELENHEFGPPRIHAHGEHRLQSGDGIAADRARVVRRQLRHGQLGHDLALRGIAVAEHHDERLGELAGAGLRPRIGLRGNDDLPKRDRGGPLRLLGAVLLPELPHLRGGGGNRAQLSFLAQLVEEALLQAGAALLVVEPAAPFFLREELGGAHLCLKIGCGAELLPHVLHGLLNLVLHLLVGDFDGGVPLRLLDQELLVHHLSQDLAPRGTPPGRIGRDLQPLRLCEHQLLFDLGREDRLGPHDRDDAVDRPRRGQLSLPCDPPGAGGGQAEREQWDGAGAHLSATPSASRCPLAERAPGPAQA